MRVSLNAAIAAAQALVVGSTAHPQARPPSRRSPHPRPPRRPAHPAHPAHLAPLALAPGPR
eukprot:CAMPEP_0181172978 /NCGR_PEP_ID=MMETSP1096-20121128/2741_1 /TAXON_ID=156174 ORGANISM="Chrysochromulina ericina, Strain CCMP281" /NCGR_SAMPLE_ID=MMETSP1096 /ASSEMBLY_ACC=CAM_ASM_000453 /LENGTH=60 /DNA_ID=CAMNT_0023260749 /DNA_START=359 /DNA_END=541 /DNA_ORIENTATION=-